MTLATAAQPAPYKADPLLFPACPKKSVDEFIADKSIGPATGLIKRGADLGLYEMLYHPTLEPIQEKMLAGTLLYALLSENQVLAERIYDDSRNALYLEEGLLLEDAVCSTRVPHRFEMMLFHPKELREYERELKRDFRTASRRLNRKYAQAKTPNLRALINHRPQLRYDIQRQLLGLDLSQGRITEAMRHAEALQTLEAVDGCVLDATAKAVIAYLDDGGAQTLQREGRKVKNVWNTWVGTEKVPGRMRHHYEAGKEELALNVFSTVAGIGASYVGYKALQWALAYPGFHSLLEQMHLLELIPK